MKVRRYTVTFEVEAYADNKREALEAAKATASACFGEGQTGMMRVVAYVQETDVRGNPMMNRRQGRFVLSKGTD